MYFLALATDYDGTLAHDGVVMAETCRSLARLKASGRRLILVTGRELPDLVRIFPETAMFDRVVAENGALLFDPETGLEQLLAPPPPARFVQRLRELGVGPISVGRGIVATWEPHQGVVLQAIRELGLELQIVFNKGAIMILPAGINKASGLRAALRELDISRHNVVAVGDAENDHALLAASGCGAAVANAVASVKEEADVVLAADHGAGVVELIDRILAEDAAIAPPGRRGIRIGSDRQGSEVVIAPACGGVLITGRSGSGKSCLATALTERMAERQFEFCVIDPEGDYIDLEHAVFIGTLRAPPPAAEALKLLRDDAVNLVVNTQALPLCERRSLVVAMLAQIARLRARTGRPHWLLIDEAHQVLPAGTDEDGPGESFDTAASVLVTAYPEAVSPRVMQSIQAVLLVGGHDSDMMAGLARALGVPVPEGIPACGPDEVLFWQPRSAEPAACIEVVSPVQVHRRHRGKYAVGDVGADRSFYFRGSLEAMNQPARNLYRFVDIAAEVDDPVWEHHLRAGDYSAWFRHVIRDEDLALEAKRVEEDRTLAPQESRRRIRKAIWRRYAAPAD
ncbi:HAD-IIB family hydrolase [Aurantimonas aggregata]|uniref:HAD-IIB family hydrolase n=1 Tax=Aurantimonas aggregata TaxID=2047720 RepID=A0A6L9MLH2_9HYPH|nr:HAD-IIB family hydrolase [Aurantimonas aggregata]NDV88575.1 HAD-IIB family hydrolase [Aurantimonas aggregata]